MAHGRCYEFGQFRLDAVGGVVFRAGDRLTLTPKCIELLIVLVEGRGNAVGKEELLQKVWPDTIVEEGSLTFHISMLRKALGEGPSGEQFIETIPKRGYRFAVPVKEVGELLPLSPEPVVEPRPSGRSRRGIAIGLAIAAALVASILLIVSIRGRSGQSGRESPARIGSIAVLPLKNLSDDREQAYFADGMTDALITDLGKIRALRVISRTSVMRYKNTTEALPEIARELQVDALFEGTVERSGDRLRITANLVQASPEKHLWADSYERDVRNVIALQNDVARTIAERIQVELTPEEHARLSTAREVDPEALKLYMMGRYFWVKRNRESFDRAMSYFQQAINRDPNYAAPYSGMADCYALLGSSFDVGGLAPREVQPKAKAAALKALELDNSLADAHNSLAYVKFTYDWDWQGAESEFKRALALNPGYAHGHHWYAHLLLASGRRDEALAEANRALELDPVSPIINLHLGWHYLYTREYDRALEQLAKTLELEPDYALAHWYRGLGFEQKKMYPEALKEMRRAMDLLPQNLAVQADIGHLHAVSGDKGSAERILAKLNEESSRRYVNQFELALIYIGLGQNDQAFKALDEAFHGHADMLVYLQIDPRFDSVRADPRFTSLIRGVGPD